MQNYSELFLNYLQSLNIKKTPASLYEPIIYLLKIGGKRIRPILTLMATDLFDGNVEMSLPSAFSVELFHNFTLMHDDIMDDAPMRRGKQTVHEKWGVNTGILSGDAMLVKAYQSLEAYPNELFVKLTKLLSQTAIEVCEGQQYDMHFETKIETSIEDYLKMIKLKTAVLLGCALKMGAYISDASESESQKIYDFGVMLGMAFQIQDDYLDAFGDPNNFGKKLGGDIIENKKTILFHNALLLGSSDQIMRLKNLFEPYKKISNEDKILSAKEIFKETGAAEESQKLKQFYTNKAFSVLKSITLNSDKKQKLIDFANKLMLRED